MSNPSSNGNSFTLATRFLHALQDLGKTLAGNRLGSSFECLNVAQIRILQLVHETPGIRVDMVIKQLELDLETAAELILAMETAELLTVDRTLPDIAPGLRLGRQGQRLTFQIKATQLSILAEMLSKLPESEQLIAVEAIEHVAAQQR